MKKLFTILTVATVMVACNNAAENTTTVDSTKTVTVDSTTVVIDTTVAPPAPVDTTVVATDSTKHTKH